MAITAGSNTLLQRLIGAAALDAAIYEEVEADTSALPQAFVIVIASSLAAGIGARGLTTVTVAGVLLYSAIALVSWAAWALITFEIGARLMPEPQTCGASCWRRWQPANRRHSDAVRRGSTCGPDRLSSRYRR